MATADKITFPNVQSTLKAYGEFVKEEYQSNLIELGKDASGELINTVRSTLRVTNQIIEVSIRLQDYWIYIENGRRPGKFPPIESIRKWIQIKPIIPQANDFGVIPTENQLAYLIGRSIAEEGIPASNALQKASDDVYAQLKDEITEALAKDLEDYTQSIISILSN